MCQTVEFEGRVIERGADLKHIVGTHNIVMIEMDVLDDNDCLCHVDVEATAAKAGMKCRRPAETWTDWQLIPPKGRAEAGRNA